MYTSEGRDARVISRLRDLCRAQPGVLLASSFVDEPYHRSSYTLVSRSADAVRARAQPGFGCAQPDGRLS